jgi:hypothetical protein
MKNCRLPGKLEAPTGLLRACSESRAVGLATGSFLERRYKLWLNTIHNPSFATTPLSPGKIKIVPPKLINFTYTEFDQIDRNA